ncbi:MAG: hypothetical protein M1823_004400 [Watsoniomyces obsoletus]|nr:MAG: hypothetical protein M1823_004400 [Watsoniomyces obsoletus]
MAEGTGVQPTLKEAFFMLYVLSNQEGKPKVNWANVATAAGLKNDKVAIARFGQIKKKLGWDGGNGNPNGNVTPATSPTKASSNTTKTGTDTVSTKVTKSKNTAKGGGGGGGKIARVDKKGRISKKKVVKAEKVEVSEPEGDGDGEDANGMEMETKYEADQEDDEAMQVEGGQQEEGDSD